MKRVCMIFLALVMMCFCGGWSATGNVELKHSGKSRLELKVESTLLETEFKAALQEKIDLYNLLSGDDDMWIVRDVEKIDGGYQVEIKTRLLTAIKGVGTCRANRFSEFVREGSLNRKSLEDWEKGNLYTTVSVAVDGMSGMVEIERGPKKNGIYVKPKTVDGKEISAAELIAAGEKAGSNEEVLQFMFLNMENVRSLTLTLPGEIEYYAGEGVTLVDENTLELRPDTIKANVTRYEPTTGELIYEADREFSSAIGYVVFRQSLSPLEITAIVIGVTAVAVFVTCALIYFYKRGKQAQRKDAETGGKV